MNKLGIEQIKQGKVTIDVSDNAAGLSIKVVGDIDMQYSSVILDPLFDNVHKGAIASGLKVVEFDLRELAFLNSSGIKAIAKWIMNLSTSPADKNRKDDSCRTNPSRGRPRACRHSHSFCRALCNLNRLIASAIVLPLLHAAIMFLPGPPGPGPFGIRLALVLAVDAAAIAYAATRLRRRRSEAAELEVAPGDPAVATIASPTEAERPSAEEAVQTTEEFAG